MNLVEVFSSVQGEGIHVGESTLFVRFAGCDLRCRWCDSPGTWQPSAHCEIETARGSGVRRRQPNPVSLAALLEALELLELAAHRWIALTGGEPLLQPEAVRALSLAVRGRGPRIHLETHGLAVDALEQVVAGVDLVSMDWKLASDVRRARDPSPGPVEDFHEAHTAFLKIARAAPEVQIKVVVTPASQAAELDTMAACIAAVDASLPVILQPVTPFGAVRERPRAEQLLALEAALSCVLEDVRVIPQTHPLYGAP